MKWIWF